MENIVESWNEIMKCISFPNSKVELKEMSLGNGDLVLQISRFLRMMRVSEKYPRKILDTLKISKEDLINVWEKGDEIGNCKLPLMECESVEKKRRAVDVQRKC